MAGRCVVAMAGRCVVAMAGRCVVAMVGRHHSLQPNIQSLLPLHHHQHRPCLLPHLGQTHTHYYHIKGVKKQGGGSEEREGDEHRTGCSTKLACRAGPRRVAAGAPKPPQPRWNRISCVRHIQTTIGERLAGQRTAERRPKARTH